MPLSKKNNACTTHSLLSHLLLPFKYCNTSALVDLTVYAEGKNIIRRSNAERYPKAIKIFQKAVHNLSNFKMGFKRC